MAVPRMSKYAIDPRQVFNMTEKELKTYIRGAYKTLESKYRRIKKSEFANFSELVTEYENTSRMWGGKLTGSTKGLSMHSLQRKALDMAALSHITETVGQLQKSGIDNIKNIFKSPKFTRGFLAFIGKNEKMLARMANSNDQFIHDILNSDDIQQIMTEDGVSDADKYANLIQRVSDELDLRDNAEKEKELERWKTVFEYLGEGYWIDEDTGEILDITNDRWL